ncbi:GAF and ANTAR domain-containing protein [Streptomyces sp. NPDC088337]|uniref:GAF and ANTAR domain-containing protein n=1 Tax=unclassified Streptomyces TaxID=2593676 RepID=UPI002DD7A51F|nr:GAF and ANTAR domain-containing protein [Streptomyces sp. NBC_01788]
MAVRSRDDGLGVPDEEPGRDGPADRGEGHPERSGGTPRGQGRTGGPLDVADVIAEGVRGVPAAEIPRRLCAVAVELLPVTGASVSLRGNGMPVRMGASDPAAARLAEIQATLGDGPSLYAAQAGAPVLASDLTAGRDARRWPVFAQQAAEAGVRAVYSVPLGDDAVCVGTLDLYGDAPHELSGRELHTARLVAGVMTLALMSLPLDEDDEAAEDDDAAVEASWLSVVAAEQDEVYQAIGMIMAQLGVGADEALALLRAHAFAEGRTALDVAHEVITHRMRFDED